MTNNEKWVALITLVRKEVIRFMRVWVQTILPPAITMSLYFTIFGRLIGSQISSINGVSYMQYIAPGLIMMAVITNSYANTVSSFFMSKFQKSIEEMLVSPMPNEILLLGYVLGALCRGLLVGLLITIIALLFTHLPMISFSHFLIMISIIILTSTLFALAGFVNAVFAKTFDHINIVPTFILTPLYLGGVFYSINRLPEPFKFLSHFNPIVYMVNAFRYGLLGISDIPIQWAFLVLIGLTLILFYYALYLLKKGEGIRV